MGDFIAFRNKGRGRVVEDNGAVSITEPRVKFIKGWETGGTENGGVECGDGTAYPMEVTVEQLSEIMYRVRDAEFVSGSLTAEYDGVTDVGTITGTRPTALFEAEAAVPFNGGAFSLRGYCTSVEAFNVGDPQPMDHVADGVLGTVYEVGDAYSPDYNEDGIHKVREAETEHALWLNSNPTAISPAPYTGKLEMGDFYLITLSNISMFSAAHDVVAYEMFTPFRTGFSFDSASSYGQDSTIYSPEVDSDGFLATCSEVVLNFSGEVAWLDDDGSGNPLSAGNRLFIGMGFHFEIVSEQGLGSMITTNKAFATDYYSSLVSNQTLVDTGNSLRLRLSSSPLRELVVPLYSYTEDYGGGIQAGYTGSTDWIFEATKWWPYADQAGDPVYDEDTGLPL